MRKFVINQDKMIADYEAIQVEKQAEIDKEIKRAENMVAESLAASGGRVRHNVDNIKKEIVEAINFEYAEKEAFFQKYISAIEVDEPLIEEPSEEIAVNCNSAAEKAEPIQFQQGA